MSKRRTKKQKLKAKHAFTIPWTPGKVSQIEPKKASFEPDVKGQFEKTSISQKPQSSERILPENTGDKANLASIKKDIAKSLILAGLILASEVVVYLFLS